MLKKTLIIGALSALAFTGVANAGGGLVVNATNDSYKAVAIGGDAVVKHASAGGSGPAIAGSIVMPSRFDCKCLKELNLKNTSKYALAVGNAIAGSIVLEGHHYKKKHH